MHGSMSVHMRALKEFQRDCLAFSTQRLHDTRHGNDVTIQLHTHHFMAKANIHLVA